MVRMKGIAIVTLVILVGCGKAPKVEEAAPEQPAQVVPVQRTVTVRGKDGMLHQEVVTDFVKMPAPETIRSLPKDTSPLKGGSEKIWKRPIQKD